MYRIAVTTRFTDDLARLPPSARREVLRVIRSMRTGLRGDIRTLTARPHFFDLAVAGVLLLFEATEDDELVFCVARLGHRAPAPDAADLTALITARETQKQREADAFGDETLPTMANSGSQARRRAVRPSRRSTPQSASVGSTNCPHDPAVAPR